MKHPIRTETRKEAIERIVRETEALIYVTELRKKQAREREDCLLCLAVTLLILKNDLAMTWEEIASKVGGISDKSHACRLSRRERGLPRAAYLRAVSDITAILIAGGIKPIDFPEYPQIPGRKA